MKRAIFHAALALTLVVAFAGTAEAKTHASRLSPAKIVQIQNRLEELGFSAGPNDGKVNAQMHHAIAEFQRSIRMKSTGQLDKETLTLLTAPSTAHVRVQRSQYVAPTNNTYVTNNYYTARSIAYAQPMQQPQYNINMYTGTLATQGTGYHH